jgi:RNA polymerase sigma-70 factor (ECF subfamily)
MNEDSGFVRRPRGPSLDLTSTVELVARAQQGDRAALERLFDRHRAPLRRWARGRLPRWARNLSDTDDLVQEALVQTFKRIDDFEARGAGALQAYLRQALLNRLRDELRRRAREPHRGELDEASPDPSLSPLARAIDAETRARYERALGRLTVDEREAIIARVEMGYTYEELAVSLGKPTADAARKAARRALIRLVNEMDDGRRG